MRRIGQHLASIGSIHAPETCSHTVVRMWAARLMSVAALLLGTLPLCSLWGRLSSFVCGDSARDAWLANIRNCGNR